MAWLILALLTALFESLKDVFGKICLRDVNPLTAAWAMVTLALPVLAPLLIREGIPAVSTRFWWALLGSLILNTLAIILYMNALQAGDLSKTVPILTFTPLFMTITSPLLVGEWPSARGGGGMVMIVAGSYLLHLKANRQDRWAPILALFREKGSRCMLLVALIWSVTSNFDKIGVVHSSPLCWGTILCLLTSLVLLPAVIHTRSRAGKKLNFMNRSLWLMGLFTALTIVTQMTAITLTKVAYVIAIKRCSALLGVFWGFMIFKESGLRQRLAGALLMIAGVFMIALG